MREKLLELWDHGSEEERQILQLAVEALRRKREENKAILSGFLGLDGVFLDDQTYQFVVPITPFMFNPLGLIHGGIVATILDSTMGSMINRTLPKGQYAVTTDLQTRYIRPGKGQTVRSVGKFIHKGKTLVTCEASLYDDRERLLAHATGTFMILGEAEEKR